MAIGIHFLRKIAEKIIPNIGIKYMAVALHPNYFINGYGRMQDNVLIIVEAAKSLVVSADTVVPTKPYTILSMPVERLSKYASSHGIRYVISLAGHENFPFHGDTQAVLYVHQLLCKLRAGMSAKLHEHSQYIDETIQIIRARIP